MVTSKFIYDYQELNDIQKEIICNFVTKNENVLVNSGPGTGKTRTIAVLLGFLLLNEHFKLEEILALTFSNKAANELRQRVFSYYNRSFTECNITTFHSFCAKLVRDYFWIAEVSPNFKLLDNFKEALLFYEICKNLSVDDLIANGIKIYKSLISKRSFQNEVLRFISLLKANLVSPKDLLNAINQNKNTSPSLRQKFLELQKIYEIYDSKLKSLNYLDFRDIISLGIKIIEKVDKIGKKFKVIIIDEFQDTDPAQFYLLSLLNLKSNCKVIAIGDPMQCIYRFRGSNPTLMYKQGDYIRSFKARVYNLNLNYRNKYKILNLANMLSTNPLVPAFQINKQEYKEPNQISDNEIKYKGNLIKGNSISQININNNNSSDCYFGEKFSNLDAGIVELHSLPDEFSEARFIADYISNIIINNHPAQYRLSEIAILVRNNYQIDIIAEALRSKKIPYQISADMKFFQSEEVTGIVSIIKAISSQEPERSEFLKRALCSPYFGVDSLWLNDKIVISESISKNRNLLEIIFDLLESYEKKISELSSIEQENYKKLAEVVIKCGLKDLDNIKSKSILEFLYSVFLLHKELLVDLNQKLSRNILLLYKMAYEFSEVWRTLYNKEPSLLEFSKYIDEFLPFYASTLEGDDDVLDYNCVKIMTIHQAKGLEFSVVFVPGLCQSIFPPDTIEDKLLGIEGIKQLKEMLTNLKSQIKFFNPYPENYDELLVDEKRLFYVAITRAKSILILTYPRSIFNEPVLMAPFLSHISSNAYVDKVEHKIYSFFHNDKILSLSDLKVMLSNLPNDDLEKIINHYTYKTIKNYDFTINDKFEFDNNFMNYIRSLMPIQFNINKTDKILLPNNFKFSATSLETYLECPRKFFFRHVIKARPISEIKHPKKLFGRAIHKCIEYIHKKEKELNLWNIENESELLKVITKVWEEVGKIEILELRPILLRSYSARAIECLNNYINAIYIKKQLGNWKDTIGEAYFRFYLKGKYKHICVGVFDRLHFMDDGSILIVDYKLGTEFSSKALYEKALIIDEQQNNRYRLGFKIQSMFYLLAILKGADILIPETLENHKSNANEIKHLEYVANSFGICRDLKVKINNISFINLFLDSGLYKRKIGSFKPGFLRSAALNYSISGRADYLPNWGVQIGANVICEFENLLIELLDKIKEDSTFICNPSENSDTYTCKSNKFGNNFTCEYKTFCQEILEQN